MRYLVLFVASLSCIVISGCGKSCDYALLSQTKSPDQKLKAVVFQRGCDTAIDSSTQISILSNQASPQGRGNIFIVGDDRGKAPPDKKPLTEIKVRWESNSSLTVSYPKNAQVILKKTGVAGVAIKYDVVP